MGLGIVPGVIGKVKTVTVTRKSNDSSFVNIRRR
jgi:hypothetical protein